MVIHRRIRESTNEDIAKAKKVILKPKLHKISMFMDKNLFRKLKIKALQNDETVTDALNRFALEYIGER